MAGEIDKVIIDLQTKLRKFPQLFLIEFLERVKRRTPVRTGKLQNGWGGTSKAGVIEVYNTQEYAEYVENGTPKMAPKGMLRATVLEVEQIAEVAAQQAGLNK